MTAAFANGLASVLGVILNMIMIVVIASVIVSWVGADPNNPIVQILKRITEPLYRPFRPLTRMIPGPLDWTPFFVLLLVIFLQHSVIFYLRQYARSVVF